MSGAKHSPMVLAAARALSDRQAAACEVDAEDMWKTYPDVFIEDAQAALDSIGAGGLVAALRELQSWAASLQDALPQDMAQSVPAMERLIAGALTKATGSSS